MSLPVDRILLVWNADSGRWNAALDSLKKLLGTGECALCDLTYGVAGERPEWTACRAELGVPVVGVHRDELTPPMREAAGDDFPVVLAEAGGSFRCILDRRAIEACRDARELGSRISEAAGLEPRR